MKIKISQRFRICICCNCMDKSRNVKFTLWLYHICLAKISILYQAINKLSYNCIVIY